PQDYTERDMEPGGHLVSVMSEPDYCVEDREPDSPMPPLTKDHMDVTRVAIHLDTEPQVSKENRQRDIAAVAVKIEPQDPTEVNAEAVFTGTEPQDPREVGPEVVFVKTEPQDPREVDAEVVFVKTEPQDPREVDAEVVFVKTEPQDPREVGPEAVFVKT
ncbi:uncharacterized protein ISCGN_031999, partial [Ixodes scapularis]